MAKKRDELAKNGKKLLDIRLTIFEDLNPTEQKKLSINLQKELTKLEKLQSQKK